MTRIPRRTYLGSAAVAGSIGLAGCNRGVRVLPQGQNTQISNVQIAILSDGETDGKNTHTASTVTLFEWSDENSEFELDGRYTTDERYSSWFGTVGDNYLTSLVPQTEPQDTTIELLDTELNVVETTTLDGYHSVATHNEYIYTASESGFAVLDTELNTVGSREISDSFEGKHMETLYIYDGVAYIVDNVVSPRYLLRVDISEPAAPEYIEVVSIQGIGNQLGQQWFDPQANRWMVIQSESHRGGYGQNIIFTPMIDANTVDDADQPWVVDEYPLRDPDEMSWIDNFSVSRQSSNKSGTAIQDIATTPPIYASVSNDDTYYLSSVSIDPEAETASFGRELELRDPVRVDSLGDNVLFLSYQGQPMLSLFDTESEELVVEQEIDITDPIELQIIQRP